ncbi:MAG: hypothetical protein AMXMBFR83_27170 [Phycisphaerae bacterium]
MTVAQQGRHRLAEFTSHLSRREVKSLSPVPCEYVCQPVDAQGSGMGTKTCPCRRTHRAEGIGQGTHHHEPRLIPGSSDQGAK